MYDIEPVGRGQTGGYLLGQADDDGHIRGFGLQITRKLITLEVLHHDVSDFAPRSFIRGGTDIVDAHDIGVGYLGRGAGLPIEAFQMLRIVEIVGQQHLQGHLTVQFAVFGQVDLAHAAGAQLLDYLKMSKCLILF